MAARTLALLTVCVLFMGCGMDGPAPTGADHKPGPTSNAAVNSPSTPRQSDLKPLDANDAPYIQGKIVIIGPWTDKWISAGFIGKGADGKRYELEASADLTPSSNSRSTSTLFPGRPSRHGPPGGGNSGSRTGDIDFSSQYSSAFENGPEGPGYRHVKMPPGDYIVFAKHEYVMLAWKRVSVKPGDQLSVDFNIDLAKTGSVVVTWPRNAGSNSRPLLVTPVELAGSDLFPSNSLPLVFVMDGYNKLLLKHVPARKHHIRSARGLADLSADVEVTPGQESRVSF